MKVIMNRRRFLALGTVPVALALAQASSPVRASAWDGHLALSQRTNLCLRVPPNGVYPIAWPEDVEAFAAPPGWVSADRTEIILREVGIYRIDWRLTWQHCAGFNLQTMCQVWDGDGWQHCATGNKGVATPGMDEEVTQLGFAHCRSDGTNRVRIMASHNAPHALTISDRGYEASVHITRMGDS